MSDHVFVSHSHDDSPAANLLVKALEERGVVCWLAPRDVPAGGSYAESILNAIESASCFVLIYSQSSNVSSHVMREVERALKFGVNIVPVRFDDSKPSKSLDYLLATVHWLAITPDARDRSIVRAAEQILAAVKKSQSPGPAGEAEKLPPAQTVAAPVASPPKRSLLWIGAALALILVAGLIGFFVSRNPASVQRAQKSEVTASAPASSATSAPETAQIADGQLPVPVTHRYFDFLGKRNSTGAYNLLSADFRNHIPIARYSKNVSLTPRAKLVEATLVSRNERTASVTAVLEDADPGSHQPRWQGPIEFVLEPGGWRISSMKGLVPASGRPMADSAKGSDDETTQDVSQPTPPPSPAHHAMSGIVQDPDGTANVREEPFVRAKVVAVVKNGDRVEIDRFQSGWAHVILGPNQSGFIHRSRLNITPEKQ
jgi:TIR domain